MDAIAAYKAFAARLDWSDPLAVAQRKRENEVRHAETEVRNAERALEGFEAMRRAVALGK